MQVLPVTLEGRLVRLEPLSEAHVPDLALIGTDENIWRYMVYGEVKSVDDIRRWVRQMLDYRNRLGDLPFAVIWQATGMAVGATRYMNILPADRGLEIGGTWYGVAYQRTGVNTECKYLLMQHAFETLGCIRVQLKTDARNLRSQRAIERLGAVKEGVLRNHMILPSGEVRDSVFYSVIDREWPQVKAHLGALIKKYDSAVDE
jgi:RimJ/RimL family protein N-acetyltransferase